MRFITMNTPFPASTEAELKALDALLLGQGQDRWDTFYAQRARPCEFFGGAPDESLDAWLQSGVLKAGRALDLGCGNGRNAIHLARAGFVVEGLDYSPTAIAWAQERALEAQAQAQARLTWHCQSVLDFKAAPGSYDLVYDSGCFHHIAPHRRPQYIAAVGTLLKPGGWFGLTCFRPEGGSGYSDAEVYQHRSLGGGLGFTEDQLREHWSGSLQIHSIRPMTEPAPDSGLFGKSFLWTLWAQRA